MHSTNTFIIASSCFVHAYAYYNVSKHAHAFMWAGVGMHMHTTPGLQKHN